MRYVLWHVERSGSNMLMSLLSQTGLAGISDYPNCGYFIGFDKLSPEAYRKIESAYFAKQATPNGIAGCKAALSYLQDIERLASWELAIAWFQGFERHVILKRRDVYAQAVSFYFASATKEYTSDIQSQRPKPPYDAPRIAYLVADIQGRYTRLESFLQLQGIAPFVLYYEDIVAQQQLEMQKLLDYLGIASPYQVQEASIQKQEDSLKTAYIERFMQECGISTMP